MCNLLARCLLRDWRSEIRIADVQSPKSLSMLSPKRLGIRIASVQSLSVLSPKTRDLNGTVRGECERETAISYAK